MCNYSPRLWTMPHTCLEQRPVFTIQIPFATNKSKSNVSQHLYEYASRHSAVSNYTTVTVKRLSLAFACKKRSPGRLCSRIRSLHSVQRLVLLPHDLTYGGTVARHGSVLSVTDDLRFDDLYGVRTQIGQDSIVQYIFRS